ncbi:MAG: hypothetical protein K2Y12_03200 [Chitinophagaceae bacterium]|nr:hypothetical protein [Chitinophagaceae bacterium]
MDISEDFHFINRKSTLFLFFTLSPTIIGSVWVFLFLGNVSVISKPSANTFNYVIYILFALQFIFFIFFKLFRRLFEFDTYISFGNNYVTIQESGIFFAKQKFITIQVEEIKYLQVTDYAQLSSKKPPSLSFNISYINKRYLAHIQLDENGKCFFNYLINYLKSKSNDQLNSTFYFKPYWMYSELGKKTIQSLMLGAVVLFFILLFTLEKKAKSFTSLFSLGLFMQLYARAREMEDVYKKIQANQYPFV